MIFPCHTERTKTNDVSYNFEKINTKAGHIQSQRNAKYKAIKFQDRSNLTIKENSNNKISPSLQRVLDNSKLAEMHGIAHPDQKIRNDIDQDLF